MDEKTGNDMIIAVESADKRRTAVRPDRCETGAGIPGSGFGRVDIRGQHVIRRKRPAHAL